MDFSPGSVWILISAAVILPHLGVGLLSDYKICGDPACESSMSRVKALRDHHAKDCRFLNFRRGDVIFVSHKLKGQREDLWAGSIDKQFGYFPKNSVQEEEIYVAVEKVVKTQRSDFFCVDEFGYPTDSTYLDNDEDPQIHDSDMTQTTPNTLDLDDKSHVTSTMSAEEAEKDEDKNTDVAAEKSPENPTTLDKQGGSPSSAWLGSSVTGWLGLSEEEQPGDLAKEEENDLKTDTQASTSIASSVTGWLGYGGKEPGNIQEPVENREESPDSITSTMSGWLGFGLEDKTASTGEEKEEPVEKFRSRRMSLDLEGNQLHEENKEDPGTLGWLRDGLSSTLGLGSTNQESGQETGRGAEAEDEKEGPVSSSWLEMGKILNFGNIENGNKGESGKSNVEKEPDAAGIRSDITDDVKIETNNVEQMEETPKAVQIIQEEGKEKGPKDDIGEESKTEVQGSQEMDSEGHLKSNSIDDQDFITQSNPEPNPFDLKANSRGQSTGEAKEDDENDQAGANYENSQEEGSIKEQALPHKEILQTQELIDESQFDSEQNELSLGERKQPNSVDEDSFTLQEAETKDISSNDDLENESSHTKSRQEEAKTHFTGGGSRGLYENASEGNMEMSTGNGDSKLTRDDEWNNSQKQELIKLQENEKGDTLGEVKTQREDEKQEEIVAVEEETGSGIQKDFGDVEETKGDEKQQEEEEFVDGEENEKQDLADVELTIEEQMEEENKRQEKGDEVSEEAELEEVEEIKSEKGKTEDSIEEGKETINDKEEVGLEEEEAEDVEEETKGEEDFKGLQGVIEQALETTDVEEEKNQGETEFMGSQGVIERALEEDDRRKENSSPSEVEMERPLGDTSRFESNGNEKETHNDNLGIAVHEIIATTPSPQMENRKWNNERQKQEDCFDELCPQVKGKGSVVGEAGDGSEAEQIFSDEVMTDEQRETREAITINSTLVKDSIEAENIQKLGTDEGTVDREKTDFDMLRNDKGGESSTIDPEQVAPIQSTIPIGHETVSGAKAEEDKEEPSSKSWWRIGGILNFNKDKTGVESDSTSSSFKESNIAEGGGDWENVDASQSQSILRYDANIEKSNGVQVEGTPNDQNVLSKVELGREQGKSKLNDDKEEDSKIDEAGSESSIETDQSLELSPGEGVVEEENEDSDIKVRNHEDYESVNEDKSDPEQSASVGSSPPPDYPREMEESVTTGTFGLFKNAFGFFGNTPTTESKDAKEVGQNSLSTPDDTQQLQVSLTPQEEPSDSSFDSSQGQDEQQEYSSVKSNVHTPEALLQTKAFSRYYRHLLAHVGEDEVIILLDLFGRHKLQFLDYVLSSSGSEDPEKDLSIVLDIERLLHHHRERLFAPSMRLADAPQEDTEKTRTLIVLQKLEILLESMRKTFYQEDIKDHEANVSCVGPSCSPNTTDEGTTAEEDLRKTETLTGAQQNSLLVGSNQEDGQVKGIPDLVYQMAEQSFSHTQAVRELITWITLEVVSALPDDIRPGPDLYGMPWEPVIITSTVGLLTILLFTCRCYSSVKSRMYRSRERWMAEQVAQLLDEKCKVLETLSQCQQEYDELEGSLKDSGVLAQAQKSEQLETKARNLEQAKKELDRDLHTLKDQLDQQKEQRIEQEKRITVLEESMKTSEEEIKELQSQDEQAHTTLKVYSMNSDRLQRNLETAGEENMVLQESNAHLRQQVEGWAERVSELEAEMRMCEVAHSGMLQDVANKDERITSLTDRLLRMKAWDSDLEEEGGEESGEKETSNGTAGKGAENGKANVTDNHLQKVQKLIYAAKLNADLKSVDEDKDRAFAKLNDEVKAKEDLQVAIKELEKEKFSLQSDAEHYSDQVQRLQQKLQIMTEMYQENELKLHRLLTVEEKERLQKEQKLNKADKNIAMAMEELNNYRQRAAEMEEELEKTKQSYQTQISAHEKKAHNNWLAARAADRELSDIRRENALFRQKLTDTQFKLDALDKDPYALDTLARPLPFRAERSPYGPSPLGRPTSETRAFLSPPTLMDGPPARLSPRVPRGPGEPPGGPGEMERTGGPHSDSGSGSPTWERDRRGPPPGPPGPLGHPGYMFPEPGGPMYRRPPPPPGAMGLLPPPGSLPPGPPHPRGFPPGPPHPMDHPDAPYRENSLGPAEHQHREPERRTPPESDLRMGAPPPPGPPMGPMDGPFPRRPPFGPPPPEFYPPRGPGLPPIMPMWAPPPPGVMLPPRFPPGGPPHPHMPPYAPHMRPPPPSMGPPPPRQSPPPPPQDASISPEDAI